MMLLSGVRATGARHRFAALVGLGLVSSLALAEVDIVPGAAKLSVASAGEQRYIVRFVEPPVASYRGGVSGLRAPDRDEDQRLNPRSPAALDYRQWLVERQQAHLDAISNLARRTLRPERAHQLAINAVTLRLTWSEAAVLAGHDRVAHVEMDTAMPFSTDVGPGWISADQLWTGSSSVTSGELGEGMVVGILDTGINFAHPSFAELTEDGYRHSNPLGSGTYLGWCSPEHPNFDPAYGCNNKIIGAWDFADASWDGEEDGPEDSVGHGSHVASTVAGNPVSGATVTAPTVTVLAAISGVAPRANLIAYDVCGPGSCLTSDVVAALDQAIADGVDVLNESIGIGGDIFQGAKQQAYLGVLDAGIIAIRSAGNSGPGASSVDSEPVWTASVAAATHSRAYINQLQELTSSAGALAEMSSVSLTSAFGPAAIVDAADFGDGLCLSAFPAETWSGEIVICTRGQIGRVQKGVNVAAGGAGGLIMVDDGSGPVADPHVLPAVHISAEDGQRLRDWLSIGTGHQGRISATVIGTDVAQADVVAGFSSRGPIAYDVIKPDMTAPGVAILAAVAAEGARTETYGVYSGTSMASPHVAGAAALLRAIRPTWTPTEVRSALMGTAGPAAVVAGMPGAATPFDSGSGRIDVERAARSGLLLNESAVDFALADPATGGDPRFLNLPSLQNSACGQTCTWQRSLRSTLENSVEWAVSYQGDGEVTIEPSTFLLRAGQERSLQVTADLSMSDQNAWRFGRLMFETEADDVPGFTMPLAAFSTSSDRPEQFLQSVDPGTARPGDELNYSFRIAPLFPGIYTLHDTLPESVALDQNSLAVGVNFDGPSRTITWSDSLSGGSLVLGTASNPPVTSFQSLGTDPLGLNEQSCDDGGLIISGLDFRFQGQTYSQVIWSVNGTLEPGVESESASSAENMTMPNAQLPALLAPFWTDLTVCDSGALRYATVSVNSTDYDVFEWDQVPLLDPSANPAQVSFQVWIERGGESFWFVYGGMDQVSDAAATVGAQFAGGLLGEMVFFNGVGEAPQSAQVLAGSTSVDTRELAFRVRVDPDFTGRIINAGLLEDQAGLTDPLRSWTRVEVPDEVFSDRFEVP